MKDKLAWHLYFWNQKCTCTSFCLVDFLRFLEIKIDDVTSEDMAAFYMHKLRDTVWPDGKLMSGVGPEKSEEQKEFTKQQATKVFADFFPGMCY